MKITKTQLREIIRETINENSTAIQIQNLEKQREQLISKSSDLLTKQKQLIKKYAGQFEYPWENYQDWPTKLKVEVAKIDDELEKNHEEVQKNFEKLMKLKGTWR
jgi:flagellar biosynthesis chaperone FliJ